MVRLCLIVWCVLLVFVFLMAIHQWSVDNQERYAVVGDTLIILRIVIGAQFAVGIKIISDAIEKQFSLSVEWSFFVIALLIAFALSPMAIVAAALKAMVMG